MTAPYTPRELEPDYARELLADLRELVDAASDARSFVLAAAKSHGDSQSPRATFCRHVLDALDGAIAQAQVRL